MLWRIIFRSFGFCHLNFRIKMNEAVNIKWKNSTSYQHQKQLDSSLYFNLIYFFYHIYH